MAAMGLGRSGAFLAACLATLGRPAHSTDLGAQATQPAWSLQLSGACSEQCELNGLVYDYQGRTGNGSPYYKARGRKDFLYYDPDCTGGGDGTPRWILDTDKPLPGRVTDLDNDKACDYRARADSFDGSHPPFAATWKMQCGEQWVDRFITFVEVTSTSTTSTSTQSTTSTLTSTTATRTSTTRSSTTTTRTTNTRTSTTATVTGTATTTTRTTSTLTVTATATVTRSSTTLTSTETATATATETETETSTTDTTTTLAETLVLGGACGFKNFLNGIRFVDQGLTASGVPYYKGTYGHRAHYIYYDLDCDGSRGDAPARWVIDEDEPNATLTEDMDEDGSCNYHARLDSPLRPGRRPPAVADWTMFCGEGWQEVRLTLTPEDLGSNETEEPAPDTLWVMGACSEKDYLNGLAFNKEEDVTVLGAPIYKSVEYEQYLYYDPACDGHLATASPRWIIGIVAPNASRETDLDNDGVCDYHARTDTSDWRRPPPLATWHIHCGTGWRDIVLKLSDISPEWETTTYPAHTVVSSAPGAARHLSVATALLLALALSRAAAPI